MPSSYNPSGGGGGTFPATTNLIAGTAVANTGADSGIAVDSGHIRGENNGGILNLDQTSSGASGDIDTSATDTGAAGNINTNSTTGFTGGSIDTRAGSGGDGGGINTSDGGGSIDTTGKGSIGLGYAGQRTTFNGSATVDRTITLPDAGGTVLLSSTVQALPDGSTATTQAAQDNSTNVATTEYVLNEILRVLALPETLTTILTGAGITPVADGTVTPVTSITTATGVVTAAA